MSVTDDVRALMQGAVDTHVHSAPDLVERKLDKVSTAPCASPSPCWTPKFSSSCCNLI